MLANGPCKLLVSANAFRRVWLCDKPAVNILTATFDTALINLTAALTEEQIATEIAHRAEMDKDSETWGTVRVTNFASEVLLFALGDQTRKQSSTVYARFVRIATSCKFQDLAYLLLTSLWTTLQSAMQFDMVKSSKNKTLHFASIKDLEDAVIETLDLLNQRTTLKAKYPVEIRMLNNFRHFKAVSQVPLVCEDLLMYQCQV
jgi:hypothetical protein